MEERLFALAQLKRKLHRTLPEILALREEIAENLSFLDVCALDITRLDKEAAALAAELATVTARIIPARRTAASAIAANLENELRQLGFSDQVRVIPDFANHEIWPGVADERGRILWAPNPGQPPQPLDKIASGGELSRFLLALASVQQDDEGATFIFDEVDAGVGGMPKNNAALLARERVRGLGGDKNGASQVFVQIRAADAAPVNLDLNPARGRGGGNGHSFNADIFFAVPNNRLHGFRHNCLAC